MSEYKGCSDGNCVLRIEPLHQHTNGGCRCLRDIPSALQRAIKHKLYYLRTESSDMQSALAQQLIEKDAVIDELTEALQNLYDWQNGPPLLSKKWEEGWGHAMERAELAMNKAEGKEGET